MTYFDVNPFEDIDLFEKLHAERKQEIISQLSSCKALQAITPNGLTFIFHSSTKITGYQVSYFDSKGPLSDIQRETIPEIAHELINTNYKVMEVIN